MNDGPVVLRLVLLAVVLVAGLAVASPGAAGRAPLQGPQACPSQPVAGAAALPPGHPPVQGLPLPGRAAAGLPPGHPPLHGWDGRTPVPARPLAPVFAAPELVDL